MDEANKWGKEMEWTGGTVIQAYFFIYEMDTEFVDIGCFCLALLMQTNKQISGHSLSLPSVKLLSWGAVLLAPLRMDLR